MFFTVSGPVFRFPFCSDPQRFFFSSRRVFLSVLFFGGSKVLAEVVSLGLPHSVTPNPFFLVFLGGVFFFFFFVLVGTVHVTWLSSLVTNGAVPPPP